VNSPTVSQLAVRNSQPGPGVESEDEVIFPEDDDHSAQPLLIIAGGPQIHNAPLEKDQLFARKWLTWRSGERKES
jgi:hypothetical protein